MKFHIITIFPEILKAYVDESLLGKAKSKGLLEINLLIFGNTPRISTEQLMTNRMAADLVW